MFICTSCTLLRPIRSHRCRIKSIIFQKTNILFSKKHFVYNGAKARKSKSLICVKTEGESISSIALKSFRGPIYSKSR